jgi:outer membrane protein OmpA-like peptidoglycan-associated protein
MKNKPWVAVCILVVAACALPAPVVAQQVERDVPVLSPELATRLEGFSYQEGPESHLEFRGTSIALGAEGEAEVEFQSGRSRVDVEVEELPPPASFGPFATYVLWAVTADGVANNLGAINLDNGRGELKATTPLAQFALIVSAEPHFAVTAPSRAIVLQNLGKSVKGRAFTIEGLKERMDYSGLSPQPQEARKDVPHDLVQARYALAIAEGADADRLATQTFERAQQLLAQATAAATGKNYKDRRMAPDIARDAVQAGEDARRRAVLAFAAEQAAARSEEQARAVREEAERKAAEARQRAEQEAQVRSAQAAEEGALAASAAARRDLIERLNRALPTRETERGIVAEISGVQFAVGAATLNPDAREALARFAGIVGVYPSLKFRVEGHTDSTGSDAINRELSLKRASTVRDYLVSQGVASSSIDVEGLGPDRPVADNETREGRARNRRVEIILSGDPVASP